LHSQEIYFRCGSTKEKKAKMQPRKCSNLRLRRNSEFLPEEAVERTPKRHFAITRELSRDIKSGGPMIINLQI